MRVRDILTIVAALFLCGLAYYMSDLELNIISLSHYTHTHIPLLGGYHPPLTGIYSQEIQQKKKELQNQSQTIKKMAIGTYM